MGRLTVLPNDEEMLLTDLSSKVRKNFQAQKTIFQNLRFWALKFFCVKKVTNIQIVTHPFLARLSKNVLEVLHDNIANLARGRKCIFKMGHFLALWPLHTPGMAKNVCRTQKQSTGLLFLSALPLNAQFVVLLQRHAKTA